MKEGDQGIKRAGEAKKKKREPKTKLRKKMVLKREDPKKKTLSRNRSPTPSNA
jgi:hypothetical protein